MHFVNLLLELVSVDALILTEDGGDGTGLYRVDVPVHAKQRGF